MEVGLAYIDACVKIAGVEEIIVAAEVEAVEHLGGGVLAEEGEGTGVHYGVAYADGDGVKIEADTGLGVGHDGRQSKKDDCGKVPKLHELGILKDVACAPVGDGAVSSL
jgi:hypothetical protein